MRIGAHRLEGAARRGLERLEDSVAAMASRGIRISKVQVSVALKTKTGTQSARRLGAFVDPVYLHQVVEQGPGGLARFAESILNYYPQEIEPCFK